MSEADAMPKFGDRVRVDLRASHGVPVSEEYVIGFSAYRHDPRSPVLMLATEQSVGCPVHFTHCTPIDSGHEEACGRWRDRYEKLYPERLVALEVSA